MSGYGGVIIQCLRREAIPSTLRTFRCGNSIAGGSVRVAGEEKVFFAL
jgi:hypothetical protein